VDDPLFDQLTDAQREAVAHVDGPLLILAGPGSGKTRVVTHRIAHLLQLGTPATRILALTFTNKAAQEMKSRVELLAPGKPVWMSTFHRFCARMLREYASLVGLDPNFTIYDASDSHNALKHTIEDMEFDPGHFSLQQIAGGISWAKNNLIRPAEYEPRPGSVLGAIVHRVYPKYEAKLLQSSAVDFDDLLLHVAALLKDNPEVRGMLDARYRYIMVDEYQDTNLAQYAIVRALSIDVPNLAVTGDPDQSIYGWRGASLRNILEFEHDYPDVHVVRLEQNYRSTKRILRVADYLIAHNRRRKEKTLFTENDEGQPVRLRIYPTQQHEAEGIATRIASEILAGRRRPRDFAIFYRVNALSRAIETSLASHGIPYQMVRGVEFFQRKEIKDVIGYLTLLANPRDDEAFLRIINTPVRGIGRSTLERLRAYAATKRKPLLEAARESGLVADLPKKAAVSVARFVALYDRLSLLAAEPVEEILGHVLAESSYQETLERSDSEDDQERLANIEELLTAAREFDERTPGEGHLEEFLEDVCLVNETDTWDAVSDRVTLMTLHASKGLEFPVVFIAAMEEGLIPHERSREKPDQLEEERRLLFVGITRAEEELELSQASYREFRGQRKMTVPSQFLMQLPPEEIEKSQANWGPGVVRHYDEPVPDESHHQGEAWEEPEWREPSPVSAPAAAAPTAAPLAVRLTTAAELAGDAASASPDIFHQGMVVRHPEYGLGKIIALGGSQGQRKATVAFATAGQRTFVLNKSPLKPVK